MNFINVVLEFLKQIFAAITEWFTYITAIGSNWVANIGTSIGLDLSNAPSYLPSILFYVLVSLPLIILVVVIIIVVSVAKKKKKKALAKQAETQEETTQEEKVEEQKVEEEPEYKEDVLPEVKEDVEEEPVKVQPKPKAKKEVKVKKVEEPIKQEPMKKYTPRANGKYVLVQEGPNWRYKLKASNGEVIIVSEPYSSEKAVRNGIETLKKNIDISRCDIIEDKHGLFSFRVMTKQGRCLATSANYKTKARAESASESYKRWALSENIILDDVGSADHTEVEKIDVQIKEEHNGKFVIKEEQNGYVYQLIASNGRVIASSNIYKSRESCLEACNKFRVCVYEGSFYVYKDKNNQFQFKLYNKQNRLVLAGVVYKERSRAVSVIESIKKLAKYAVLIDNVIETPVEEPIA